MLRDILGQAWEAMVYNRRRTAITMIGMAWGIATVVLLLAYGAGFSRAIEAIFAQWGTNIIGVFPGRTSQQAGADKAWVSIGPNTNLDDPFGPEWDSPEDAGMMTLAAQILSTWASSLWMPATPTS